MSEVKTKKQISAGGVAFRKQAGEIEVALISVSEIPRWQLPKGRVDKGESNVTAAMREVHEEAGVQTENLGEIDQIAYWFYIKDRGALVRIHKIVHFFLLRYQSGDTSNHDFEVNEARWVDIDQAMELLAFESEKNIVRKAKEQIAQIE